MSALAGALDSSVVPGGERSCALHIFVASLYERVRFDAIRLFMQANSGRFSDVCRPGGFAIAAAPGNITAPSNKILPMIFISTLPQSAPVGVATDAIMFVVTTATRRGSRMRVSAFNRHERLPDEILWVGLRFPCKNGGRQSGFWNVPAAIKASVSRSSVQA